jgi:CxxC motif-containing protein (DUF1111 family)
VFNDSSCGACHSEAGLGGGKSTQTETRFGKRSGGAFDPLASLGGSLIQVKGIGDVFNLDGSLCATFVGETVPSAANVTSQRRSTPLFGFGLVDAVPDGALQLLAGLERQLFPGEGGRVGMVQDIARNRIVPGRFGWKAQVPTVHQFAGDAYLNEMGITSKEFPDESCPQGNCDLLACNPVKVINDGPRPNDPTHTLNQDVSHFQDFMTLLGPPPRGTITPTVTHGETVFRTTGCNHCHTPTLVTGSSPVAALQGKVFHPFSDFLLHDMGSLGDGIALGGATGQEFRTAPLWGLRKVSRYLHDGRATSLPDAIQAHDGQGKRARDAFVKVSGQDRADLLQFLNSL